MKIQRIFNRPSWAFICLVLFLIQAVQTSSNLLYAESNGSVRNESAASDQTEAISRDDIIFKARNPKTRRIRPQAPATPNPRRERVVPRAHPVKTGTVVSRPGQEVPEGTALAHASMQTNGPRPVNRTAPKESLQEAIDNAYESLLRGKKYDARKYYSAALFLETSRERRNILRKHLDALNNELVFSPIPGSGSVVYKVKPGDNLTKISKEFHTTPGLIMKTNRKKDTRIRINEPLKIITGQPSIVVDKSEFSLILLLDGHFIKQYHIGTGKNNSTPEGTFVVETRLKNPVWYSPEGVYAYGHPKNILGTRWLGFQNEPGIVGYGIHGTTMPESLGTEASNGCIRMRNEDVEELYDFVTASTEVTIKN
ncbi:MAG: L,D-transpeptidase family protein [Planctomycetota bacterium]|jgi:lipoprotein-anchoring transpeptidase ErfK/SrfK